MAVIKTCLLLCLGALLLVSARSEMAGENGGVYEIKSLSDWHGKLEEGKKSGKLVVAEFWAPGCDPCKIISPAFDEFSGIYGDVIFVKVDTDDQTDVAQEVGIRALPIFWAFKDGSRVGAYFGINSQQLEGFIVESREASLFSIV